MYKYLTVERLEQIYAESRVCSVYDGDYKLVYGELEAEDVPGM